MAQQEAVFWAWDYQQDTYYPLRATRVHAGPRSWIYVAEGSDVPLAAIRELAELFEDTVYHRLRSLYGHDPDQGVDGEAAITLLLLDIRDPLYYNAAPYTYISGYFDPTNEYRQVDLDREMPGRKSNEREMLYLDVSPSDPRGIIIKQTLAHEFAHLIQWNHDDEEAAWLNEGLSELAVQLCGLGHPRKHVLAFLEAPEVPLVTWDGDARDYGKVYLFMLYLHELAGETDPHWLQRLVASRSTGIQSVMQNLPIQRTLPEIYRDYGLALYVDDPTVEDGRFGFKALDLGDGADASGFPSAASHEWSRYPITSQSREVRPWAVRADRFTLGPGALEVEIIPSRETCVGSGWSSSYRIQPGDTRIATACLGAGQPVVWPFPSFGIGRKTVVIHAITANASESPLDITLRAIPQTGIESQPRPAYLPLNLAH